MKPRTSALVAHHLWLSERFFWRPLEHAADQRLEKVALQLAKVGDDLPLGADLGSAPDERAPRGHDKSAASLQNHLVELICRECVGCSVSSAQKATNFGRLCCETLRQSLISPFSVIASIAPSASPPNASEARRRRHRQRRTTCQLLHEAR